MENQNSKRYYCGKPGRMAGWIVVGIIGVTAFVFLFGAVIMWLWNCLMPVIFHLGVISYWQAVGLAILARLLFGSLHHGNPHHHKGRFAPWRHRFHMNDRGNGRDFSNGAKWNYYDQYWNEEGERAFNEYVRRKNETSG